VDQSGINVAQAVKVVEALHDHQMLFDLEAVELNDKPRIELKDGDVYKDSLSISKGQKCTSILPILLLDSDRPLLVDQPEDNLDNGFIYETVVRRIREVKNDRQLIFVTHNPNIPVLGDASKVFVFKSNGSKAWIEKEGTVDDCRTHIVDLLEGGEEAFKLRQQRYEY
jgi:ABC-type lipoprotein export system ATPase subunit